MTTGSLFHTAFPGDFEFFLSPGEGCTWPVDYSSAPCDRLSSFPASGVARIEQMAVEYLWRWTDRQFGLCTSTIRPCREEPRSTFIRPVPLPGFGGAPFYPVLIGGDWINVGCGNGCGGACGCDSGRALRFEDPIYDVLEVVIDGAVLDRTKYRVDEHRFLVREDGGHLPYRQNLDRPAGDLDTWTVAVQVGAPVPVGGQLAAGKLACELAKAILGGTGCELPQRWQNITRAGVTISAAIDLFEGLEEGKTGIWLIDSWVASVVKPQSSFSIAAPDRRHSNARRTTSGRSYPPIPPNHTLDGGTP
jgi:hypothetical protein